MLRLLAMMEPSRSNVYGNNGPLGVVGGDHWIRVEVELRTVTLGEDNGDCGAAGKV